MARYPPRASCRPPVRPLFANSLETLPSNADNHERWSSGSQESFERTIGNFDRDINMDCFSTLSDWLSARFGPSLVADDLLASLDIAEVNLACAKELPGAEDLDVSACVGKVDEWSEKVRHATSRNYGLFNREPHLFDYSLGKFYMAVLCTTLQRECGVRYNSERANDPGDARDSSDRFIHGITHGAGGTCASLPVLYAAVGRRLGYPLRIVQGARHLFLRWDESTSGSPLARDRFNIEATADGFVSQPDRFYQQWPFPHPDPDVDPQTYLRSLTPREELASFLCIRSIVLMDNGRFVQAIQPAAWARHLAPHDCSIKVHLELTMLLALGILDEKPSWMDEYPVIRPDGATWSRYWWPRPMENRELLPAAQLPPHILMRILPPDGPVLEVGDLADALYERAGQYADEAYVTHVLHAAISEQHAADAFRHNAMNRARQAMLDAALQNNPQRHPNWPHSQHPAVSPAIPGIRIASQNADQIPLQGYSGLFQNNLRMPGRGQLGTPGFGPDVGLIPGMPPWPAAQHLAVHGLLSLAARRPPFPFGGMAAPPQPTFPRTR